MIKNLIFDIGNVLVGYRWKEMLMDDFGLADEAAERIGHELFSDSLWTEFDRGDKEVDQIIAEYIDKYPQDESLITRFFHEAERMRVNREDVWDKVEQLKCLGYRIYLLSNYSEYLLNKHTDCIPFMKCVDGRIVSYEVNMLKPEPQIYKALMNKYSLDPQECVFFDDLKANVVAADELGIRSYEITSKEYLLMILDKYLTGEFGQYQTK